MTEQVVTRRRVVSDDRPDTYREEASVDDAGTGLGVALAVALAIIAVLALFALARGVFNPAPSSTTIPSNTQVQPGTTPTPTQ